MKRLLPILSAAALLANVAFADPVDAVLIVQNHASDEFQKPLSNLGDQLAMALSGEMFNIIDPNDAIGDEQNRGPWGENLPLSSATRLADMLEADVLITASVGEASVVGYGVPARVQEARMKLTLSLKRLPKGSTLAAVTVPMSSDKMSVGALAQNADAVYSDLVNRLVEKTSAEFLAKCKTIDIPPFGKKMVEVAFGCNFPGADVSIDGVSYGTAGTIGQPPLRVRVRDGVHNLRISYPYTNPYEVRAAFQEGTTFMVVLTETDEGRKIRKEDRYFDTLMRRIESSGATDDAVRMIRARGYGRYLSSSYTRLQGMPKVLSFRDCQPPDLGLNPDREGDGVGTSTRDLFDQAGSSLGYPSGRPGEKEEPKEAPATGEIPQNATQGTGTNVPSVTQPAAPAQTPAAAQPAGAATVVPAATTGSATPAAAQQPSASSSYGGNASSGNYGSGASSSGYGSGASSDSGVLDTLHDIREGVDTSKDIIQGIKDIGDILK